MKIHLYAIIWNDERIFPFFLTHYLPLCDKIILFDNGSTNNKVALLAEPHKKIEIRHWDPPCHRICVEAAKKLSEAWKESIGQADWVFVIDIDEFLYHPKGLLPYLSGLSPEVNAIHPLGYQMIDLDFPKSVDEDLTKSIRKGFPDKHFDKLSIFKPDCVTKMNYGAGRHVADHSPLTFPAEREVKNLHYKLIGRESAYQRGLELNQKMREGDRAAGIVYRNDKEAFDKWFHSLLSVAVDII